MTELCANSVLAAGRVRRSSILPLLVTLLLLLLTTWLPVASTQPIASTSDYWTLTLNGQRSDALAELSSGEGAAARGVLARCTADEANPAYVFTWTLGEGTCLDASSQTGSVLLPPAGSPQQTGQSSTMQIPIAGLRASRYYFVRCRAQSGRFSTSMCAQFRLYERTAAAAVGGDVASSVVLLDSLANGSIVSLQCDSLVIPSDVVVNVTWTRDGARLPTSAEQQVTRSGSSSADNATYVIASRLVFDNSPAAGGSYTCTMDSVKYGKLLSQTTIAYRAAVAVFVDLNESADYSAAGQSRTRVAVTCEGYGYPAPVVSLVRGQFMFYGNQTRVALEGGTRSLYVFHQPRADGAAEMSSYGCRAENDRAVDIAHYSEPQHETDAAAAATSVGAPAATAVSVETTATVVVECKSSAVAGAQNGAQQRRPTAQPIVSLLALMSAFLLLV